MTSGVGNTEREEVVQDDDDDLDEDKGTETEIVTVERTEDPVAEAEELMEETDELPVVAVAVEEVDVAETLHISSSVMNKQDINIYKTEVKCCSASCPAV